MFIPAAPPGRSEAEPLDQTVAPPLSRTPAPARRRPRSWRMAKIAAALAVLALGAAAELGSLARVQSTEAIVSAPRVAMRAPINGTVVESAGAAAGPVRKGQVVVRLENPLASRLPLQDLQARADRLRAERAALATRRASLAAMEADLRRRADRHAQVLAARLDGEITAAEAALAASAARRDQAARDLARRRSLAATGDVALADLERAQTQFEASSGDARQQDALRASLRTQRDAAAEGVDAEAGPNEASYAAQRRDEVALRLGDLDQSDALLAADLRQTETMIAATEADLARRAGATLVAPADALLWRATAQPGDVVAAGDVVAELVLCDQQLVVAAIPQTDLDAIVVGGTARTRLAGETGERAGKVVALLAENAVAGDPRLAAVPPAAKAASAMALVSLGPPPAGAGPEATGCLVGRNARVILPRAGGTGWRGLLDRLP